MGGQGDQLLTAGEDWDQPTNELAQNANNMTLYLNNVYGNPTTERWFKNRWAETGKKLDMEKSCVYFKKIEDLPLDVNRRGHRARPSRPIRHLLRDRSRIVAEVPSALRNRDNWLIQSVWLRAYQGGGRLRRVYIVVLCIILLAMEVRVHIDKDLVAASATPLVLTILAEGESYGYAILKRVRELSGGELEWADGMLYPLLHRLRRLGYVTTEWRTPPEGRRRRYYAITDDGQEALAEQRRQWATVTRTLGDFLRGSGGLPIALREV